MPRSLKLRSSTAALVFCLPACGGGGGGGSINSTLAPVVAPSPAPMASTNSAPAVPPVPAGPIGLTSDKPFSTVSAWTDGWGSTITETDTLQISFSSVDGSYTVKLPGYQSGEKLGPARGAGVIGSNGTWALLNSTYSIAGQTAAAPEVRLDWPASSPYTYTNFGGWVGALPMGENDGVFAYGVPTPAVEVPKSGSASYKGQILGRTNGYSGSGSVGPLQEVYGSVSLQFDFAAGALAGEMKPQIGSGDGLALPTYSFRNTKFAVGSNTFSGQFAAPEDKGPAFFSGRFTGPGAAELMASWEAPFQMPGTQDWQRMNGVWIAKKSN